MTIHQSVLAALLHILGPGMASADSGTGGWELADLRMQGEVRRVQEAAKALRKLEPLLPAEPALEGIFRRYPVVLFGGDHTHMTTLCIWKASSA